MKYRHIANITILLSALAASACGSGPPIQPDAFAITRNKAITYPASFKLIHPEQLSKKRSSRRNNDSAFVSAQTTLFGKTIANKMTLSTADNAFLIAAKATKPSDRIRYLLELEHEAQSKVSSPLAFILGRTPPVIVVDPIKESRRLVDNMKEGRSIKTGDSHIVYPSMWTLQSMRSALQDLRQ